MAAGANADAEVPSRAAPVHVVELFTSQGCSSCPPADRLLTAIARDPHIIALSFAVDYWDYIGWKDLFASPLSSARQNAYARAAQGGRVYTPQVVIDGGRAEVGSDQAAILRDLGQAGSAGRVPITLDEGDGRLRIEVGAGEPDATGEAAQHASVYVLRVDRSRTVSVGRGENSGRSLTYTNVVRAMSKLGDWDGRPVRFDMPKLTTEGEGYVVLLQIGDAAHPAAILAAAKTAGL